MRPPATVLLMLALLAVSGCRREPADGRGQLPQPGGTSSTVCAGCHAAIYREWRRSAHAAAFTREEFRIASQEYEHRDCLRCHVPTSLDRLDREPVREKHRAEGVNCESCHLAGDAYAAPTIHSSYASHKVAAKDRLAKSEFCGQCHKAIFQQWLEAKADHRERKTCQGCHMPTVRRRTVSGSPWHALHRAVDSPQHEFAMVRPSPGKRNILLSLELTETLASRVAGVVTLTNVGALHGIPSGEFGFRELAVVTSLVDRYGIASAKRVERFVAAKHRFLPYGEPQALPFHFDPVPQDVDALVVQLVRSSYAGVEAVLDTVRRPLRAGASAPINAREGAAE